MDEVLETARRWSTYIDQDDHCLSLSDALAVARALLSAHEKIETRDTLIKSQAECIERLREVVHSVLDPVEWQTAGLQPGDMGEPTNEQA